MSKTLSVSKYAAQPELRHEHVPTPASRAYFAWQQGKLDTGQLNQREAGKFFPAVAAGLSDPVAPPDGKIASANQGNGEFLDESGGTHWEKHNVVAGELLTFSWSYSAKYLTRRWNYFITRQD